MRWVGRAWVWLVDDHPGVFVVALATAGVLTAACGIVWDFF